MKNTRTFFQKKFPTSDFRPRTSKTKFSHRVLAVFFALTFLQTLIPYNQLWANNNGPKAPEAGAFEPVDATDMVNLLTGDLSYVLPLLNVPSPEGGYPLALSYHAGIAMDQEASWVGLGWNLNPGAINRSINGFPDDYRNSTFKEYFYDEGGSEEIYNLSVGYGSAEGTYSIGLGFSWGSNKSLTGSISISGGVAGASFGGKFSTDDRSASVNGGFTYAGLSFGASIGTDGVGINAGFSNNGTGFSIGVHSSGRTSIGIDMASGKNNSIGLDLSFSKSGFSISGSVKNRDHNGKTVGGFGTGIRLSYDNPIDSGDYITKQSGYHFPIIIPTPYGIFSASFGKQKLEWYLNKTETNSISGPLYFNFAQQDSGAWRCRYFERGEQRRYRYHFVPTSDHVHPSSVYTVSWASRAQFFMDVHELSLTGNSVDDKTQLDHNNATFPNYDKYNVDAQGLSGTISPRIFESGALLGLSKEHSDGYRLSYSSFDDASILGFEGRPHFYFDNEYSSYLGVNETSFIDAATTTDNIFEYHENSVQTPLNRRKTSKHIEYFANDEIENNLSSVLGRGFLKPHNSTIDRTNCPKNGIGAYTITGSNGKKFHYSLPVYNYETLTRSFGMKDNKPEASSYFEKTQVEPYATHWLLTAVTGPDFIDKNNNGYADEGDYGYWVNFEYGKWSEAYTWKAPYAEDYIISEDDPNIKSTYIGVKDIYYLNKVKTRTHAALFIKSLREDDISHLWEYRTVSGNNPNSGQFNTPRFIVPSQKSLKLDKIILVKNEHDTVDKTSGDLIANPNSSVWVSIPREGNRNAFYNLQDNIIDYKDDLNTAEVNAIKVIDFKYKAPNNSLAKGTPHTSNSEYGRLTLESADFKGKRGTKVIPPYTFEYSNHDSTFNIDNKSAWGYHKEFPQTWSLNKIVTPEGGKIEIDYENHEFKSVIDHEFQKRNASNSTSTVNYTFELDDIYNFQINDSVYIDLFSRRKVGPFNDCDEVRQYYKGPGKITNIDENSVTVIPTGTITTVNWNNPFTCNNTFNITTTFYANSDVIYTKGAGVRVKNIKTSTGTENYQVSHSYNKNGTASGYISYVPFAPELQKELPYSSELPPPKVMYEYVTVVNKDINDNPYGIKKQYHFSVLKSKTENEAKFEEFYEIKTTEQTHFNESKNIDISIKNILIEDNLSAIGQVLDIETYNQRGQLLNKVENNYFSKDNRDNDQGTIQESFQTYKIADYDTYNPSAKYLINSTSKRTYSPAIKSTNNIAETYSNTTYFDKYNYISGLVTESRTISSDNIEYKTKVFPAFTIPEYSGNSNGYGMGSKVDNPTNKNMLTQTAASLTQVKDGLVWSTINANMTTWNNDWQYRKSDGSLEPTPTDNAKIWRKHKNFIWKGDIDSDGAYVGYTSDFDNFNWTLGASQANSKWINTSTTILYDHYSTPLESEDINGNRASTKMGDNYSKVIAVANAKYTDMYYSGAEYIAENSNDNGTYLDGEVKTYGNIIAVEDAHTGNHVIQVNGQNAFEVILPEDSDRTGENSKYKVSVWVRKGQENNVGIMVQNGTNFPRVSDFKNTETIVAGDWVLLNGYIDILANKAIVSITANGTTDLDDFRLLPLSSSMTNYVYNEWDELSHIIGANGLSTKYEYDDAGRLKKIYAEVLDTPTITGGFKKTSENRYNYKHLNR